MLSKLDQTKLSLAQSFVKFVKVEYVGVAHSVLKAFSPSVDFLLACKVNHSRFVWWDHNLNWVVLASRNIIDPLRHHFVRNTLEVCA